MNAAPPTLADLLSAGDDTALNALVQDPRRFLLQAQGADEETKAALVALLSPLWPSDGLQAHMSVENGQWDIDPRVYAIIVLGPAIDLPLDPERWVEIACSGFVFSEQAEWLRRHFSNAAGVAASSCQADDVRIWAQILSGVPEQQIPEELVDALREQMRTIAHEGDVFHLGYVGQRLFEARALDALKELVSVDETFRVQLAPWLAAAGDVDAARDLLGRLEAALLAGEPADRDHLEWLDGIEEPSLLPSLFACLRAALAAPQSGGPFGAVGPVLRAIRRIGGESAVAGYDELIVSSDEPSFRFMRASREELAQDELRKAGQGPAREAASSLGLPYLGDNDR